MHRSPTALAANGDYQGGYDGEGDEYSTDDSKRDPHYEPQDASSSSSSPNEEDDDEGTSSGEDDEELINDQMRDLQEKLKEIKDHLASIALQQDRELQNQFLEDYRSSSTAPRTAGEDRN